MRGLLALGNRRPGRLLVEPVRARGHDDFVRLVGADIEAAQRPVLRVEQLVKLDPYSEGDPRVWGLDLSASEDSGLFATPALHEGLLYTNTHQGSLIVVDTASGEIVWQDATVGWHSWSSPSVVDDTLVVATCAGDLRGYSLANPRSPQRTWTVPIGEGSCLEATPAIWNGSIYLGSRDGFLRAIR